MAFDSFRGFVQQLDRAGELKRISQPVATELEITALADREMKSANGGKALLIEKPTVNGAVSPFPVAINTLGSWKRMAISLGAESVDAVATELGSLMKAKPPTSLRETMKLLGQAMDLRHAKPRRVKDGPCKEVIQLFEDEDRRSKMEDGTDRVARNPPSSLHPPSSPPPSRLPLPIQKCWPLHGSRFSTLPFVVTNTPTT